LTIPLLFMIGSEFMPPLYEGSQLYMPTSPPGLSITEATKLLQVQDKMLRKFPEVETVFGTVGRGTTSTDNTPMGMVNTTVTLKHIPGTRSVYAERVAQGYFTDIRIDREAIARHGLMVGDVEDTIESAIGGQNITRTIEGRERYPVNVRYEQGFRDTLPDLQR